MTAPTVPRNTYTNAPELRPNLVLGSLQLLSWVLIHPSAWRNHVARIAPKLSANFSLIDLSRRHWGNPKLWQLLIRMGVILPLLAGLLVGMVVWACGGSSESIRRGMTSGVVSSVAISLAFSAAGSVASSLASAVAVGIVGGVAAGLRGGGMLDAALGVVVGVAVGAWVGVAVSTARSLAIFAARTVSFILVAIVATVVAFGAGSDPDGTMTLVVVTLVGATFGVWLPMLLYPFEVASNLSLYSLDRWRPHRRPSFLRWHSAFWDELQRLPLIGLDSHLVLVMERDPSEGRAALNYLATSRQRWAAQAAQIELDVRRLERCDDVEAIGDAHRGFGPGELEGPASALLRSFGRISQDVDAACNQESAYNRRLALSVIEDRLNGLVRELTRSSDRFAARFRPVAARWREIVAEHVRDLAAAVEQRQEIDSPYVIGVPLTEQQEIFVGRADVSARIEQLLLDRRRPPLLLYGQRRMGKTSLLLNLGRLLPSTVVPLFVDLQGPASTASDHAGFLYNVARGMIDSASRQRSLTLPLLAREALAADPFTRFDEWLDEVERALGQRTALLTLDEFEALDHALVNGRFDETAVLGTLRHLIQHRPRFKVLLAGSHTLEELELWSSYLINVQVVQVGYLKEDEARQLVERPVEGFPLRYEEDASRRVLDLTRGHPFLVQLLCAEIVAFKNEQEPSVRRLAGLSDVEAAVPEALSHGSFFFADIERNQVDPAGLAVLWSLAAHGERAVLRRQALAQQIPEPAELDGALTSLHRRDLIEPANGGYRFQVELIRRWFADRPEGSMEGYAARVRSGGHP